MYHTPVLLDESVNGIVINSGGVYVDTTFGGGGHSRKILDRLDKTGKLFAFDQDTDAQQNLIDDPRFCYISHNFQHLKRFLQFYKACPVDGILADLGVSSHQFDAAERGFSHRFDGKLDMRMDNSKGITAAEVINAYPEQRLAQILSAYGELNQAYAIALRIKKARLVKTIETTGDLVEILSPFLPKGKENKTLSQIFQAIRIEVNQEMEALKALLEQAVDILKPNGRIAIISYHSLEDRLVKNFLKSGNFEGNIEKDFYGNPLTPFRLITRKAIVPQAEEIAMNPRARSAKLRIAEIK